MKNVLIVLLFLISVTESKSQSTQTQLNQVELMKQFIGTWECEMGGNTIYRNDNKVFGNGMSFFIQVISNGEIVDSVEQLLGYDTATDKFVLAELIQSSSNIEISSSRFITEHTGEIIAYDTTDNSTIKINFGFASPDVINETAILDNNITVEMEFHKITCDKN